MGFTAVLSMCMAVTALGIDTVLPAYGEIREAFDLDADATEVTGLVSFFFLGNSLGLLPAGLLSDRFGRKVVMWGGLAFYMVFAVASSLAGSLTLVLIARFFWGVSAAGPRVAAQAMVRDAFEGEQMARQMSLVMAVFLLVPAVGPALSVGLLAIGSWQLVFWVCAAAAAVIAVFVGRIPETLTEAERRPLDAAGLWSSIKFVMRAPGFVGFVVTLMFFFASFLAFLGGSELVLDQTYDLEEWFPVFFAGLSIVMLGSMLLNGRLVETVGLDRMLNGLTVANLLAVSVFALVVFASGGDPPFAVFVVTLAAVLFFQQMLIPNITAAAMRPLGAAAGTGTALLGMLSGGAAAILAEVVNRQFDGTVRPLAVAFFAASAFGLIGWRLLRRSGRASVPVGQ